MTFPGSDRKRERIVRIAVASDHAGYELKQAVIELLQGKGHEVLDLGPDSDESVDYPDYAIEVASSVAGGRAERGMLICGTGLGMCITANKVAGVRAVGPCDTEQAEMSRRHNDANVLCLGQRSLERQAALQIVSVWLDTPFEGGRHSRRLEIIAELERNWPHQS